MVAAAVAAALSVAAGGGQAAAPANGPIYFSGLRTENFYSELYSVAPDGSGRVNLTQNSAPDDQFAVSPDGTRIAFVSRRDGYSAIYVMNADGSDPHRVCTPAVSTSVDTCVDTKPRPGSRLGGLLWSPTGQMIAFKVDRGAVVVHHPIKGMGVDMFSLDLSTGRVQPLGRGAMWLDPWSFSPDGRFIAHASVVLRADTGAVVSRLPGSFVSWAPHGLRLHYTYSIGQHMYLATADLSGRRLSQLRVRLRLYDNGDEAVTMDGVAWSPDGRSIAFWASTGVGGMGASASLYLAHDGEHRYRLLKTVVGDVQDDTAAWSPNGDWLSFFVNTGDSVHTYLLASDGRGSTTLDIGSQNGTVWSPDSRYLAMLVGAGVGSSAVVVTPPSTDAQTIISSTLDPDVSQIGWAGDRLVFASSTPGPTAAGLPAAGPSRLLAVAPDGSDVPVPTRAPPGRIAPEGTRVSFVSGVRYSGHIWTARLDGTGEQQLTDTVTEHSVSVGDAESSDSDPAWSPDGRQIAFVREGTMPPGPSPSWCCGVQIFVVPSGGGAARPVTAASEPIRDLGTPAWSPDGSRLAYVALTVNDFDRGWSGRYGPFGSLHLVNLDGTNDHVLTLPAGLDGAASPAWSPDGARLVFATCKGLAVINADGSGFHALTTTSTCSTNPTDGFPAWSPDGTEIVFVRNVEFFGLRNESSPPSNLWTIKPDATGLSRLTDVPSYDTEPTWLPS
jgi:Tol biopolymer transport system component